VAGFVVANIVLLPVVGVSLGLLGPETLVGRAAAPYEATAEAVGQGTVDLAGDAVAGAEAVTLDGALLGQGAPAPAIVVDEVATLVYVGRDVVLTHAVGLDGGTLVATVDGEAAVDPDGAPVVVDLANDVARYDDEVRVVVAEAGPHTLALEVTGGSATITGIEVAEPPRDSSLVQILAILLGVQLVAGLAALALQHVLAPWAERLDARRGIVLALVAYLVIAVWGFRLDTVLEFWGLAWLVGVVQGGSQALSRSLYTKLVPVRREGEFFGLFSILAKFASFLSPLLFVASVAIWDSSRPAVLALAVMFGIGIWLLLGVDVARGQRDRQRVEPA
jgi:hypothetical protein